MEVPADSPVVGLPLNTRHAGERSAEREVCGFRVEPAFRDQPALCRLSELNQFKQCWSHCLCAAGSS